MPVDRNKALKRFGKSLAQLRHEAGLTQEALADRAGLHPTYIGGLERGARGEPSDDLIIVEADTFERLVLELETGGALAFKGFVPPYEATLTKNLRDAGAIIIAKTNMTELANWIATGMPGNYNALVLLLMKSPVKEVQAMTPHRIYELLLGRSMLASLDQQTTTLWIDPVPPTSERVLQQELVRLFNEASLTLRGRSLLLRLRDPTGKMPQIRVLR